MKYIITILLFLPLAAMAQADTSNDNIAIGGGEVDVSGTHNVAIGFQAGYPDPIADSLHKYTDSFMFYRCQVHCKEPKAGGFYLNKREKYREIAQHYYNLFDSGRTKTNVRFRNPDHYSGCPCKPVDSLIARYQDSLDYYREEWEHSGRKNQIYQRKMFYFSRIISDRSWQNYINKAKKP